MTAGQKILIVEDEPSIADNIVYALSTDGFEPIWCQTAAEGREVLDANSIKLIILDVGLPDENGFEFAKQLRQTSTTPIIFVTARADEVDRIVGLEIGADDYVVKPFSPRELSARVKAVLRRVASTAGESSAVPRTDNQGVLRYGPFVLDEVKHVITYHEQALDLSRYEFRLLAIMLKSPGRVYSRDHLMQLAWEEPDMSLQRTVDTHIKTIRQKLRIVQASEDLIVTHRGIGYSIREVV